MSAVDDLKRLAAAPPEEQATWHASLFAEEYAQIENVMARPMGERRQGKTWRRAWLKLRTLLKRLKSR